jgi:putative heme-binding domain-containing protein
MIQHVTSLLAVLTLSAVANPADLVFTKYAGSDLTPSPACLAASATGEVYVGVDLLGSLGKGPGKGRVVRLVDTDQDGKADKHTIFAHIDNPRGLLPFGDKLYILHTIIPADTGIVAGMNLSVLEDKNGDGIADGPPKTLIRNVSVTKHNQDRGADHTTNGIRMGIDGWIYIAVGDFGFVDAEGADGTTLTMLGGGVLRVRPDGTEMEVYTHGLRNIYDVAIDPFMNIFTRDNTNDGGGWNIRFSHHIQTAQYGYPILFKNFTSEIIPALADLGGGSGTGSLFLDESTWPDKYNQTPMMADWGRNQVYIHRITPDGPSFTQKAEDFITISQVTDLDVDGSGQLYIAAWEGAGYKGNASRGFVQRVVPSGWTHKPFPDLSKLAADALVQGLATPSATTRLATQQELLARGDKSVGKAILAIAKDTKTSLASRVAALFTYKQLLGAEANAALLDLVKDADLTEFALRAAADRIKQNAGLPLAPFEKALTSSHARVRAAAAVALGRLGKKEAAAALLTVARPPAEPASGEPRPKEGPHATPNPAVIVPHVAIHSLVQLQAADACLAALDSPSRAGALRALQHMHEPAVVDGLLKKHANTSDIALKNQILTTLARLYTQEAPYDGSWWWNTKPDTRGPYYKPILWAKSADIEQLFRAEWSAADSGQKEFLTNLANKYRMNLEGIGSVEKSGGTKEKTIGEISIENIMIALDKRKGDPAKGREWMKAQACIACHSIAETDPKRGPDLNKIGATLDREAIAEAILKPDAVIASSWVDVTTRDGTTHQGTLVEKSATQVVIRNIAGIPTTLNPADVKDIKTSASTLMGPHLMDGLTLGQFVDIIAYLHSLK